MGLLDGMSAAFMCDAQVVAGDHSNVGAALKRAIEGSAYPAKTALLNERSDNRNIFRAVEQWENVSSEWIGLAARCERRDLAKVVTSTRNDMAHATARVVHVAVEARDDVHVKVHDRLARICTSVETDVVAIGLELRVERALHDVDELEHRDLLLAGGIEPSRDHASRDDQRVSRTDRISITNGECVRVVRDPIDLGDQCERIPELALLELPRHRNPSYSRSPRRGRSSCGMGGPARHVTRWDAIARAPGPTLR